LGLDLGALVSDERNFSRFYEATGGAPLAIRWSIGQIKQRGQSIDGVLNSLHGARGDIFELIFKRAWSLLSESSIKILMVMPIFASSASKAAIEAASDVHNWELDEGLGQLVELWLLESNEKLEESKRRYSLHPLTRAFAQNRLSEHSDLEHHAKVRLAGFFDDFAKARGGDSWTWERYDEIEEEKENIFALIDWCFENANETAGMKLTKSLTFFMNLRGYVHESFAFGQKALDIARQQSNTEDLAWLLVYGIGWREIYGGNLEKSEALMKEGLRIYENLNSSEGIGVALRNLGRAFHFKGNFAEARQYYLRSLILAESSSDQLAITSCKRKLSSLDASEGRLLEAKEGFESILPILRELDVLNLVTTLRELAEVNLKLKQYDIAFEIGREGLELATKMKKLNSIGWFSFVLAHIEAEHGNYQSALSFALQALEYSEKSGIFSKKIEEVKALIEFLEEKLAN